MCSKHSINRSSISVKFKLDFDEGESEQKKYEIICQKMPRFHNWNNKKSQYNGYNPEDYSSDDSDSI